MSKKTVHYAGGCPWASGALQGGFDTDQRHDWDEVTCGHCLRNQPKNQCKNASKRTINSLNKQGEFGEATMQYDTVTKSCPKCGGSCSITVPSVSGDGAGGLIINLDNFEGMAAQLHMTELYMLRDVVVSHDEDFCCAWCKHQFRLEIPLPERVALAKRLLGTLEVVDMSEYAS